jgi:hypothetical protein
VKQLLVFRRFTHDPDGILAAVYRLALVGIERRLDFLLRVTLGCLARLELGIATFAYADGWERRFYDPQFALLHDCSLTHQAGRA